MLYSYIHINMARVKTLQSLSSKPANRPSEQPSDNYQSLSKDELINMIKQRDRWITLLNHKLSHNKRDMQMMEQKVEQTLRSELEQNLKSDITKLREDLEKLNSKETELNEKEQKLNKLNSNIERENHDLHLWHKELLLLEKDLIKTANKKQRKRAKKVSQ